jgi:hypothetical protein
MAAGAADDRAAGHGTARMRLAQMLLEAHAVSLGPRLGGLCAGRYRRSALRTYCPTVWRSR